MKAAFQPPGGVYCSARVRLLRGGSRTINFATFPLQTVVRNWHLSHAVEVGGLCYYIGRQRASRESNNETLQLYLKPPGLR